MRQEKNLARDEKNKKIVAQVSERRKYYREEAAAAKKAVVREKEELAEAQEELAKAREELEKKREIDQEETRHLRIELTRELLEAGATRAEIINILGDSELPEEELDADVATESDKEAATFDAYMGERTEANKKRMQNPKEQ